LIDQNRIVTATVTVTTKMSTSFEDEMLLKNDESSDSAVSNENGVETNKLQTIELQQQMSKAKALSMSFMKSFSGLCCDDCDNDPFNTVGHHENSNIESIEDNLNNRISANGGSSFFGKASSISPLIVGPMMAKNLDYQQPGTVETIVGEYMCFCRFYKVHYNSGILTALRFSSPSFRPSGAFHDADMLALVELLLRHANGALKHVSRLDFTIAGKQGRHERNNKVGFSSNGALSLAKALQTTKYIRQVFLPRNRIGQYGASAIFMACRMNPSIEDLNLKRCQIGQRGAMAFCEIMLLGMHDELTSPTEEADDDDCRTGAAAARGLVNVNLSLNHIGHQGTTTIGNLMNSENNSDNQMVVNLDGNLVFPEIMNSVTHCVGVILSILGGRLLSIEARDASLTHRVSCAIYTWSLLSLYLSSTLFHSFFAMVNTRHVFRVMDKCAIYILIAGSYTPFMQILLSDQPIYSFGLLGFIWVCCVLGVTVEALYPNWKHKPMFSLSMYLGMGWSCVICLPQMVARLHAQCAYLILFGGVAYTAGVPFFIRNNNLDHAIWHLFVMSGSILHWIAIYFYVASTPLQEVAIDS